MAGPLKFSEGMPDTVTAVYLRDEHGENENVDEEDFHAWAKDHVALHHDFYDELAGLGVEVWLVSPRPDSDETEITCDECNSTVSRDARYLELFHEKKEKMVCEECFEDIDAHYVRLFFNLLE